MFGKRISGYLKGVILSILLLAAIMIGGNFAVKSLAGLISGMPI
jgi:hypothetical protein